MLSRNVLLYGSQADQPAVTSLRAGPLSLLFQAGDLRYVVCGGREILRRIYVAVRDQNWGTVPAELSGLEIDSRADSFRITYLADHRRGPIHFRWRAEIEGSRDGRLTFRLDGQAMTAFKRNRIGVCVHHPVEGFAGQVCEIETVSGERRRGVVPVAVAPHQPFQNIRSITHEFAPGCRAKLLLEGETFEMEDQRNWSDASFKTYGTPLSLPFPVEIAAGTVIRQRVCLTVLSEPPRPVAIQSSKPAVIMPAGEPRPMPGVGVAVPAAPWAPSAVQWDRLRALRLSHLRVDADSLEAPAPEVAALGVPIEVAILLGEDPRRQLQQAARLAKALHLEVARWVICEKRAAFATAAAAALARTILPAGRIVGGTRGNFAELNRNRPAPGTFDGLCFPVNPQVHATDNYTLAENCAAQRDVVESARTFSGGAPVFVSPVTLKQQFNPVATGEEEPTPPGELPLGVDPRQMSLFGAAWTVASLKHLSEAGAAGITCYETAGWKGVMETLHGSPLPLQFPSIPGCVFPLWHVLADLGEFPAAQVLPSVSSRPLEVECLALQRGSRTRLLVVNLSPEPQAVEIAAPLAGPEARVRILDACNAEEAMVRPEAFRAARPAVLTAKAGRLSLTLDACALATLDCGAAQDI